MAKQEVDNILESYQDEKNEKLLKQFESLRPKPFAYFTAMLGIIIPLLVLQNFTDFELFKHDNYISIMFIVFVSGAGVAQSIQINKRIDLLANLLKNNAFNRKDT